MSPMVWHISISIHALREEGDRLSACGSGPGLSFLSTPSARRATIWGLLMRTKKMISIHALREEGDFVKTQFLNNYG